MVIVDDHLGLLAIVGRLPNLEVDGPVATTWAFKFRMARAVLDAARHGSLSRRTADSAPAIRRVLYPPSHRLLVLDPRTTTEDAIRGAVEHDANLLLAVLLGAAVHHRAAIRVTPANVGRSWQAAIEAEGVDFATVPA